MKVIVISGPTASGKTAMAIELARKYGGEIVNFDSLLLYQEINIGTAKPTQQEQDMVPHHMINIRSISHPINAADFAREAYPIVEKLLSHKKIVYLVGGSGFYLQALLKGMYQSPTTPKEITRKSDNLYASHGIAPFRDILKVHDKKSFERYHENDHYRIRRAVEHWWTTELPFSLAREDKDISNEKLNTPSIYDWKVLHLYLNIPKEEHWKIIEERTDKMLKEGLIDEVRMLLNQGFTGLEKPLQSIGYKESLEFIFGVYPTISDCRDRIVVSTRQLAKSQRTWFNRDKSKEEFHPLIDRDKIDRRVNDFLMN
jgi:tRNA dimethylallyltransferase